MKKIILFITLLSFISFNSYAEYKFNYTRSMDNAIKLSVSGLVFVVIGGVGLATDKNGGDDAAAAFLMALCGSGIFASSGLVGITATIKGMEKVDRVDLKKKYRSLKTAVRSASKTKVLPKESAIVKMVNSFDCVGCNSEEEKVQKFSDILNAVDKYGYRASKELVANRELNEEIVVKKIKDILGEQKTVKNLDLFKRLFSLSSFVYAI